MLQTPSLTHDDYPFIILSVRIRALSSILFASSPTNYGSLRVSRKNLAERAGFEPLAFSRAKNANFIGVSP